jgi:Protein of unknown function (DUF3102)
MTQDLFDYRNLNADQRRFVKERAVLIRETAKQTAQGIVRIGQWLSEVKGKLEHGAWLPWLKGEFGWGERTARNFMSVHQAFKSANFADLRIDVSALYLIAAPSTPAPVVQEVIKRARAGEPITRAKAVDVLEDYKTRAALPTPSVARQIAIATGKPTAASNNTYVLPMTAKEERALADEQYTIRSLYTAITNVADTKVTPEDMVALGEKHYCRELHARAVRAAEWLDAVIREGAKHEKRTA